MYASETIVMWTRRGDQCICKVQPELTEVFNGENVLPVCVLQMAMFIDLYNLIKDTLKAFDDFKNAQQKCMKKYIQKYIYSESLLNTLYIEIKHKC